MQATPRHNSIPILFAIEHIRPMRGGSNSQLLRASDNNFYVVKFRNNCQHPRIPVNELIAALLASHLGLPVPPFAFIDVCTELIASSPGMVIRKGSRDEPCAAGLQFGSRMPTVKMPIYDFLPDPGISLTANLTDFIGVLLFDQWTCNCDRRQVIFCRLNSRCHMRMYMIDQGFCFNAGEWNFPDNHLRGIYDQTLVYTSVTGWNSFQPWLDRIEDMRYSEMDAAMDAIPDSWNKGISRYEIERLFQTLYTRRGIMRRLILDMKAAGIFPNWGKPPEKISFDVYHKLGQIDLTCSPSSAQN